MRPPIQIPKEAVFMENEEKFDEQLEEKISGLVEKKGLTRRDFIKFCGLMAATLGLEASYIPKIANDVCPKAMKVIAVESCACDGGLPVGLPRDSAASAPMYTESLRSGAWKTPLIFPFPRTLASYATFSWVPNISMIISFISTISTCSTGWTW
jgi:hypothetical protein